MFRSQNFLNDGPGPHDDADGDDDVDHSHLHPKPEEIDLEYTYAGLHKTNTESTRLDSSPRECALAPPPRYGCDVVQIVSPVHCNVM